MNNACQFIWKHGVKLLAIVTGALATLAATGVIPEHHMKYYMAAIAVLTYVKSQVETSGDTDAPLPPPAK